MLLNLFARSRFMVRDDDDDDGGCCSYALNINNIPYYRVYLQNNKFVLFDDVACIGCDSTKVYVKL